MSTKYVDTLVALTVAEHDAYHGVEETDEPLRSRIDEYCVGIGIDPPVDITDFPWSATFVSWCIKTAGATRDEFKFDPAHAVFVKAAIANADAERGVFRARPIDTYAPKIGDLIHRNRSGGTVTYKQARMRSNYPSHSAIVVELGEDQNGKYAVTIGGNEGDSIRRTRVSLDANGKIAQKSSNPYICVVEDLKVEATISVLRSALVEADEAPASMQGSLVCEGAGTGEAEAEAASLSKPRVDRTEATTHQQSRGGADIDHIVIHYTTSRNIEGTITHFKTGTSNRTSAHYIVGRDGLLVQMVPDDKAAWHAGKPGMNLRSIGIEHVAALGDRITAAQERTSIALIRWLMAEYGIPLGNVIPHVCVKPTSCCGDLFAAFGGGAGKNCDQQKAALHSWMAANGIGAQAASEFGRDAVAASTGSQRMAMARAIVNFEARRDSAGRLIVYQLPPEDGGGRYEVAGINERYHKQLCDELVRLIESGRHAEAENRAAAFMAEYTDTAANWTSNPGVEFYLRDSMFNRGPGGAAWILQHALGVPIDRVVGPATLAAVRREETQPLALLQKLRLSREAYERLKRDERSRFWRGLVNRWNKALAIAKSFISGAEGRSIGAEEASANVPMGFEYPPEGRFAKEGGAVSTIGSYQPPPQMQDMQVATPAVIANVAADSMAIASDLQELHQQLEAQLFSRSAVTAMAAASGPPARSEMIVGVGVGPAHRDFESVGPAGPGAPVLNVYVAEPMGMEATKAVLVDDFSMKALSSDQRPVNVIHTGPINALAHTHRQRPSPCGISVAHYNVTAGTLGVLARGRSDERRKRLLVLSNNHVLANVNDSKAGDAILQPGKHDMSADPANQIGVLEQWVPINFDDANFVDCATAWVRPDRVRTDFIYRKGEEWAFFKVDSNPVTAAIGMGVGKSGRTTQLTSGRIIGINNSIRVNFGEGRVANFRDQIAIKGNNNQLFSRGGDSGSLIWTWSERRAPVGLLFAGGGDITFANKIEHVLKALDIDLVN